jgi:hypothetical protein
MRHRLLPRFAAIGRALRVAALVAVAAAMAGCVTAGGPEMTFRRVSFKEGASCKGADCATVIAAEGRVTRETPARFAEFVKEQSGQGPTRNVVILSSPGGHVGGSLGLGLMLRSLGSTVLVARADTSQSGLIGSLQPTNCYSACAYTLMAARKRIVPTGSQVGIHRMHSFGNTIDPTREGTGTRYLTAGRNEVDLLKRYAAGVGADPRIIDLAESVPPDDIRILTPDEMRRFRMPVDRPF